MRRQRSEKCSLETRLNGYDVNELQWKGIARIGFETAKPRVLSAETDRQRNASHVRGVGKLREEQKSRRIDVLGIESRWHRTGEG